MEEEQNDTVHSRTNLLKNKNYLIYKRERQEKKIRKFHSNIDVIEGTGEILDKSETNVHENVSSFNYSTNASEKEDTIKSGESVFKIYTFEPSKYNTNIEKCTSFWRSVLKRDDLKPVNCTLIKPDKKLSTEEVTSEKQTETESSISFETYPWCQALLELQKRNLDKLALASSPDKCKFCEYDDCKYNGGDVDVECDLSSLDTWNPKKVHRGTNVQHAESLEATAIVTDKEIIVSNSQSDTSPTYSSSTIKSTETSEDNDGLTSEILQLRQIKQIKSSIGSEIYICSCGQINCNCNEKEKTKDVDYISTLEGSKTELDLVQYGVCGIPCCPCEESESDTKIDIAKKLDKGTQQSEEIISVQLESTLCIICGQIGCSCQQSLKNETSTIKENEPEIDLKLMEQAKRVIKYILHNSNEKILNDIKKDSLGNSEQIDEITKHLQENYADLFGERGSNDIDTKKIEEYTYNFMKRIINTELNNLDSYSNINCFSSSESKEHSSKLKQEEVDVKDELKIIKSITLAKMASEFLEASDLKDESDLVFNIRNDILVYYPKLPKKEDDSYKEPGKKL